jgi:hypothetical protein
LENVWITRLIQNAPLAWRGMFSFNYVITPVLTFWKNVTPLTPKLINLEVKSILERLPYYNRLSIISLVRLSIVALNNICSKFNKISMHFQPSTTYTWTTIYHWQSTIMTSSTNIKRDFVDWTTKRVFVNTSFCMHLAIILTFVSL